MSRHIVIKLPSGNSPQGIRLTRILIALTSIAVTIGMFLTIIASLSIVNGSFRKNHGLNPETTPGSAGQTDATLTSSQGGQAQASDVTLTSNKTTATTGETAELSWSVSGGEALCTATDDWAGAKKSTGKETVTLTKAQTYLFTLTCTNDAGTNFAVASISVTGAAVAADPQTASPTPTPTPTATSPKPGTTTSAPQVSVSVSPTSIPAGSSATIKWSTSGNPTTCTASNAWSGSKAPSGGSYSTGVKSAGTYTYTLSCSNGAGTATKSATLSVSAAPTYCGGRKPCYGRSDLAAHASVGNCWAWNKDWVINITSYQPNHPGGVQSGAASNIQSAASTCNHDIGAILAGSAGISGYRDTTGGSTYSHSSSTISNAAGSVLAGYRVGYYDANKP